MPIGYSEGRIEKISEGSGMHQMIRVSLNLSLPIESEVIDLFYLFQLPNGLYFDDYELERNWQHQPIRLSIPRDGAPYEDLSLDHELILPLGLTGIEFLSLDSTHSSSCSSSSQRRDCIFHHNFSLPIHQQYHQAATQSTISNSRIERKLAYPLVFIRPSVVDGRLVDTRRCQERSYLGKTTAEVGGASSSGSNSDGRVPRCVHLTSLLQAHHNRIEEEAMKGQGSSSSLPIAACSAAQMIEWNRWIGGYNPVIIMQESSNVLEDRIPSQHEISFLMPVGSMEDLPLVSTVTLAAVISSALVLLLFIFKLKNTA
eukprot:scaffold2188_cov182-Ochromonas_danica.AAC.7